MAIERFQDKNGRIRYKDTNTGRFVKLSSWTRQAARSIIKEDFEALKPREKQSIKANQRIRNNGKFINKHQEKKILKTLEKTGQKLQNNDLFKTFGKEAAKNILSDTFQRWVNSDEKNQFNVEKEILRAIKQGLSFTYVYKGKKYFGMDGLFKLLEVQNKLVNKAQKKRKDGTAYPALYIIKQDKDGNLLINGEDTQVVAN